MRASPHFSRQHIDNTNLFIESRWNAQQVWCEKLYKNYTDWVIITQKETVFAEIRLKKIRRRQDRQPFRPAWCDFESISWSDSLFPQFPPD